MMGYASRTGTKRNLDALRAAGWGLMVSATGVLRTEGFTNYALDNGAWTAHQKGEKFEAKCFEAALDKLGHGARFIVAPDVVAGGISSLELSLYWIPRLRSFGTQILIPVQDGMEPRDLALYVGPSIGIFLGGSTDWKLSTMRGWGWFAQDHGIYFHVGRVNSERRIRLCALAGANSFDGTSATRFCKHTRRLDLARRQTAMRMPR